MALQDFFWEMHLSIFQHFITTNDRIWTSSLIPRRTRTKLYDPNKKLAVHEERYRREAPKLTIKEDVNESSPRYEYESMPPDHIRLLHLLPASGLSDGIKCSLTVHAVDESLPPFEALSYTWGDAAEKHWIQCGEDGKAIQVTRNLLEALQHLRPLAGDGQLPASSSLPLPPSSSSSPSPPESPSSRVLWIDAVCINQGDIPERGQQVQIMDAIYDRAARVVVWLGPAYADSSVAFKLMHKLALVADATAPQDMDKMLAANQFEAAGLPGIDSPAWMALDAVYWRPWFMRAWIVQEIAVARSAVVVCGPDSITFETFAGVSNLVYRRYIDLLTGVNCERILPLMTARIAYQSRQPLSLLSVLSNFRTSLATQPVDKVYAMLNISAGTGTDTGTGITTTDNNDRGPGNNTFKAIRPDYTREAPDVFRDVARHFLEQSLDILSLNCDPAWRLQESLASWAPDWSCVPREYAFLNMEHWRGWQAGGGLAGAAAGYAAGNATTSVRFSPDSKTLFAEGRVLGRVKDIGEAFMIAAPSRLNKLANDSWTVRLDSDRTVLTFSRRRRWRMWERLVRRLGQYPQTGEDVRTVLQKTIIADAPVEDDVDGEAKVGEGARGTERESGGGRGSGGEDGGSKKNKPPSLDMLYNAFRRTELHETGPSPDGLDEHTEKAYSTRYFVRVTAASYGRKLFTTKEGYVGLGPCSTMPGDHVVLLHGGKTAYVLRQTNKKRETFEFLGESYLHGFMHGEGLKDSNLAREFAIV